MRKNGLTPALIGSALLHVAVFGFALWKWPDQTREVLNAVPVQIVSDMPALAPAPAADHPEMDETPTPAVEEPAPEPTPPTPEPPKPTPPKPEPKPVPPKPDPKKPEPKPEPKSAKADKAPVKKPTKEAETSPLDFVKDLSRSSSKPKSSQDPNAAKGTSRTGTAQVDTGPALNALVSKLNDLWIVNCAAEGVDQVVIKMQFKLSNNGRISDGPRWVNRNSDTVWMAAAERADAAISKGQPYTELPSELFNQQITVNFIGKNAC
ncbi:hypothetical protein [Caulobacter sp. 17J80-11]|uniref:hypothetical protein n=1 Tax=Caulobacter sp. 17J80-11 TaxID=2763502 RepID=UPI00165363E5|nr:hypothetical protein [Caulobacter sp. 17J80-11]MBC6980300.1 hypothetical protein [Caulobacter sp. 17J80-11]